MITWTTQTNVDGDRHYIASNGARVYLRCSKPFAREWGVQLPGWTSGDGGFRSMKEAKAFVERQADTN